jgi:hypothetical protein
MHVYFGKHVKRAQAGGRLVRVVCARCECEYFYHLARVGIGHGEAPYYIGVGRATRAAEKQAQKDLERRLSREAELVPCPRCSWINDELIVGYRIARYSFLRTLNRFTLLIGAIVSAVFGFLGAILAPKDLVFFLILPLGIVLFAGAAFVLRLWLCSHIRPNRDFPLAPQLPPGSPPALVRDPENGTLIPASPPSVPVIEEGDWCDFQIGRHRLPAVCCGCLNPVPLGRGFNAVSLMVPWCADCELARTRTYWRIFFGAALSGWLVAAVILLPLNLQNEEFWIACLGAAGVCLLVAAVIASKRTAPVKVSNGDRSRSVVRLRFRNVEYTQLVALHRERATTGGTQSRLSLDKVPPLGARIPPSGEGRDQDVRALKN